jgi:hypothetical protein
MDPKLRNQLSTVKGHFKAPMVKPDYLRVPPKDSSDVTVSTSQKQSIFNVPTAKRLGGEVGLKFTMAANAVTDATTGNVNPVITFTQSGALTAGYLKIGFTSWDGKYAETGQLAYDSTVAALKAAVEALPNFKVGEAAMTATFDAQFDAGAAVTLTISGTGAQQLFDASQFAIKTSDAVTSAITVSTQGSGLHIESGWALIQRIRISHHGTELMNLREAGKYASILRLTKMSKEKLHTVGALEGIYDIPSPKIYDNVVGRDYILSLSGIFDLFQQILPNTMYLSSGPLEIEIVWAPAARCCVCQNANAVVSYALSDIELHVAHLDEKNQPKGVPVSMTYTQPYLDEDLVTANSTRAQIKITRSVRSATRLYHVLKVQGDLTDVSKYQKNQSFISSGKTDYRLRLNGKLWPNNRVESPSESYRRFKYNSMSDLKDSGTCKTFYQYRSDNNPTNNELFKQDGFIPGPFSVICEDFRIPMLKHHEEYRGGGVRLEGSSDSTLEINKTASASVLTQYLWLEHDTRYEIKNGSINVQD